MPWYTEAFVQSVVKYTVFLGIYDMHKLEPIKVKSASSLFPRKSCVFSNAIQKLSFSIVRSLTIWPVWIGGYPAHNNAWRSTASWRTLSSCHDVPRDRIRAKVRYGHCGCRILPLCTEKLPGSTGWSRPNGRQSEPWLVVQNVDLRRHVGSVFYLYRERSDGISVARETSVQSYWPSSRSVELLLWKGFWSKSHPSSPAIRYSTIRSFDW